LALLAATPASVIGTGAVVGLTVQAVCGDELLVPSASVAPVVKVPERVREVEITFVNIPVVQVEESCGTIVPVPTSEEYGTVTVAPGDVVQPEALEVTGTPGAVGTEGGPWLPWVPGTVTTTVLGLFEIADGDNELTAPETVTNVVGKDGVFGADIIPQGAVADADKATEGVLKSQVVE